MFTTNHYSEQDVTDAMGQMEQRLVTFSCCTTVSFQYQRQKTIGINRNLQDVDARLMCLHSAFKQRH